MTSGSGLRLRSDRAAVARPPRGTLKKELGASATAASAPKIIRVSERTRSAIAKEIPQLNRSDKDPIVAYWTRQKQSWFVVQHRGAQKWQRSRTRASLNRAPERLP